MFDFWIQIVFSFIFQVLTKGFGFHLRDLCNATPLEEFVRIADRNVSDMTQEIICRSSSDWLNKAQNHFLSNLDFLKPIRVSLYFEKKKNNPCNYCEYLFLKPIDYLLGGMLCLFFCFGISFIMQDWLKYSLFKKNPDILMVF